MQLPDAYCQHSPVLSIEHSSCGAVQLIDGADRQEQKLFECGFNDKRSEMKEARLFKAGLPVESRFPNETIIVAVCVFLPWSERFAA